MVKDAEEYSPLVREFGRASRIIDARIAECNSKGEHTSPNYDSNICSYCFQHLVYSTPKMDEVLKGRQKLPLIHQPMDAPSIIRSLEAEINSQKFLDRLKGIEELMDMKTLNASFQ